jgi:hypothetical protein
MDAADAPLKGCLANMVQAFLAQTDVLPLLEDGLEAAIAIDLSNEDVKGIRAAVYNAKAHEVYLFNVIEWCICAG